MGQGEGAEKGPQWARGGLGTLTTSSMMGSGLAASSCSFTFSSTRGCKTTTQAGRKGASIQWGTPCSPGKGERVGAETHPWRPWAFLALSRGSQPPETKTAKAAPEEGRGVPRMKAILG